MSTTRRPRTLSTLSTVTGWAIVSCLAVGCADDGATRASADGSGSAGGGDGDGDTEHGGSGADAEPGPPLEELPSDVYAVCDREGPSEYVGVFSNEYEMSCAGCHGRLGEGFADKGIPALPGASGSLEAYAALVRAGRHGEGLDMPPFSASGYSDEAMAADWERMIALPLDQRAASAEPQAGVDFIARMSHADIDAAIQDGLPLARMEIGEGACASCHGPELVDLARIAFRDGDILRRATGQGLSGADAQALVRMVHAVRAKYGMRYFCDPREPFLQPGGEVLPGDTPEELDMALFAELGRPDVGFAGPLIHSHDEAQTLIDNLREVGMMGIRVGFRSNDWTRDEFFGPEQRSVAEWIPELSRTPRPELADEWYALHDAYIEEPSADALWAISDRVLTHTSADAGVGPYFTELNMDKYRSVLLAQHMMRTNRVEVPELFTGPDDRDIYMSRPSSVRDDPEATRRRQQIIDRGANVIWGAGFMAAAKGMSALRTEPLPEPHASTTHLAELGHNAFIGDLDRMFPWMYLSLALTTPSLQFIEGGRTSAEYYRTSVFHHALTSTNDRDDRFSSRLHHWLAFKLFLLIGEVELRDESFPPLSAVPNVANPVNGQWTLSSAFWVQEGFDDSVPWGVPEGIERLGPGPDSVTDPDHALAYLNNQMLRFVLLRLVHELESTGECLPKKPDGGPTPEKIDIMRSYLLQTSPLDDEPFIEDLAAQAAELVEAHCPSPDA